MHLKEDSILSQVLRYSKKTDAVSSKAILQQAYETTFGIHDHVQQVLQEQAITDVNQKRPLAVVGMHHAEDTCTGSQMHDLIRLFLQYKIHQYFGLNLMEFLELPHEYAYLIMKECAEAQKKASDKNEEAIDAFKREAGE